MPYGGPRFEFFTQNQYSNHAAFIRKEDVARAAAIERHRHDTEAMELEQARHTTQQVQEAAAEAEQKVAVAAEAHALRQRRLAAEAGAAAQTRRQHRRGITHHGSSAVLGGGTFTRERGGNTWRGAGSRAQFTGSARVLALSQPRPRDEPANGALTYGMCMHQRGKMVEFPMGRNGQSYTPGVDRDRIVPARPDTRVKPWEGSHSTHQPSPARRSRQADNQYYLAAPDSGTSAQKRASNAAIVATLTCANIVRAQNQATRGGPAESTGAVMPDHCPIPVALSSASSDAAPSVFSHGSSNNPIAATGTKHMVAEPRAGRAQVTEHLSRYGGAITALGDSRKQRVAVCGGTHTA